MKKVILTVLLILAATVARGDLETHSPTIETPPGPSWEPLTDVVVKWAQAPDPEGQALASQLAADYPFDARSADDFLCEDGAPVVAVEWWGSYWNPGAPPYADHFVLRFYSDLEASPHNRPGQLLREEECFAYAEEADGSVYHYSCTLDTPFEQEADSVYWLSVQAVHGFFSGSQWGWSECVSEDYWNSEATLVFPELGVPQWTAMSLATGAYHELAFVLYGNVVSPVETVGWSRIKAMFR